MDNGLAECFAKTIYQVRALVQGNLVNTPGNLVILTGYRNRVTVIMTLRPRLFWGTNFDPVNKQSLNFSQSPIFP